MGTALNVLAQLGTQLPEGYTTNYGAQSRQFVHEKSSMALTFFFAVLMNLFIVGLVVWKF